MTPGVRTVVLIVVNALEIYLVIMSVVSVDLCVKLGGREATVSIVSILRKNPFNLIVSWSACDA